MVDPLIYIDPTWEFAHEYELLVSEGVELVIPEPATAALLAVASLSLLSRGRKR